MTQGGHNKRGQSKSRRIKMWHNMIKFYLNTMPLQQHELQRQRVNNTVSLAGLLCCFASQFNCSCCAAFSVLLQQLFSRLLFLLLFGRNQTGQRQKSDPPVHLSHICHFGQSTAQWHQPPCECCAWDTWGTWYVCVHEVHGTHGPHEMHSYSLHRRPRCWVTAQM